MTLLERIARIIDPEGYDFGDLYDYRGRWPLALERAEQVLELLASSQGAERTLIAPQVAQQPWEEQS